MTVWHLILIVVFSAITLTLTTIDILDGIGPNYGDNALAFVFQLCVVAVLLHGLYRKI